MHLLILGGGAAGTTAAIHARRMNEDAHIRILSAEPYTHYSPCGMPYVLSGKIKRMEDLIVYPPSFYKMMQIELHLDEEGEELFPGKVRTKRGKNLPFDALIIATGSKALLPSIPGVDLSGIFTLRNLDDGKRILCYLEENPVRSASIVGGGPLGIEVAYAFSKRGIKVSLIEKEGYLLSTLLDTDMAIPLQEIMKEKGISLYLNESLQYIEGGSQKKVVLTSGECIYTDLVLLACGVKPNTSFAESARIKTGDLGAIKVDEFGTTSHEGVFAAGECIEWKDFFTSSPTIGRLGSIAVLQGKVVAENVMEERRLLPPILNATILDVFGIEIGAMGLKEEGCKEPLIGRFEGRIRDSFYPDCGRITIKILAGRDGRILGAQLIGREVFPRLLSLLLSVQAGADIERLISSQTTYVPSLCATFEPLILAVQAARYA